MFIDERNSVSNGQNLYTFMILPKISSWLNIKNDLICKILNYKNDIFKIDFSFYCDKQNNSSIRKRYCKKRIDDTVLDCELKVRRYVYLKMKCTDRKFDENAVYAQLLTWYDGMDYSKFHGLKKGSVDLLRFVLLNWMSGFFADAEEHQFLISFLPSTTDPDSIIELLK